MDKPVLNVRANLHKYKMKLFPVSGQRLCDESRSVLHFFGGGNHQHVGHATTSSLFSRMEGQMSTCVIEQSGADALSSRTGTVRTFLDSASLMRAFNCAECKVVHFGLPEDVG